METQVKAGGKKDCSTEYSAWFDRSVVLVVLIRGCDVPVRCNIVGESLADVRVHIEPGWEMDIPKDLILAVEDDTVAQDTRIN